MTNLGYNIPYEWSALYAQTFQNYLVNTKEGKEYIVELFDFSWRGGESDSEYTVVDTGVRVSGEEIYFLETAVVKNEFVPITHVDEYKIVTEKCDSCGAYTHCLLEVKGMSYCNHCLHHSEEHHQLSDGLKKCELCTVLRCPNHPVKLKSINY